MDDCRCAASASCSTNFTACAFLARGAWRRCCERKGYGVNRKRVQPLMRRMGTAITYVPIGRGVLYHILADSSLSYPAPGDTTRAEQIIRIAVKVTFEPTAGAVRSV